MKVLVFDNYDSFTYNLVHIINAIEGIECEVYKNDRISLEDINQFDKIVLSPGPGLPSDAGILHSLIKEYAGKKSIFGVCLGLQAIVEVFGGKLLNLTNVYHGVATPMEIIQEDYIFENFPKKFKAGRYHSWVGHVETFPKCLEILAQDEEGQIMAIKHKEYDIRAVQFHPESILTPQGTEIIKNFINKPL